MSLLRQACFLVGSHQAKVCVRLSSKWINRSTFQMSRLLSSHSNKDVVSEMPLNDPVKGELVYAGPLWKMVRGVKAFSISTSVMGLSLQPYLLMNVGDTHVATVMAVGGAVSFFIFITPFLIHFVTKKYVRYCYWNRSEGIFTVGTYSLFVRKKELQFKASDVVVPDIPGMFTSIVAKGRPLFMDLNMFYSKDAYVHLMGYDKPIDWTMPDFTKKDTKEK